MIEPRQETGADVQSAPVAAMPAPMRRLTVDSASFGAMLREVRERRELTWDELAHRLGIKDRANLRRYVVPEHLSHKRPLSLDMALRLAGVMGVRIVAEWW